ncbi:MAG: carboxypeptidase-like regulatory domain-containing protein [Bacteroidetes bacterium]|nr:carboxypeptidase-like regulatory domain-containing protein [Bacteroidota bacterium]
MVCLSQLNFDFQQGKFLIKGKVVDVETKNGVPLTNIRINGTNRGVTCDNEGIFAFYVYKNDTLKFTSTGYLPKTIHIADLDSNSLYTLEIQLIHDFVKLKQVIIYPFRDKEEFEEAFMDARNLNKITIAGIAPPKYSNKIPKAKFTNPISFLYERIKKRRAANPDFRP